MSALEQAQAAHPRHEPAPLAPLWTLWRSLPRGLRRSLQRTGLPYAAGHLARYRRAHAPEHFAGTLPRLKVEYLAASPEQRAALSARFDAIVDQLVLPNGVTKTTFARRQETILARVLEHPACALPARPLRVLDVPSSAATGSLQSHAMLAERWPLERYVLGDLCFDVVYDPLRRSVYDEAGNLLQVATRRGFVSLYRPHVSGEVCTWLSDLLLAPLDARAAWLRRRFPYEEASRNLRLRVLHPEAAALERSGVFQVRPMDVFQAVPGRYDLILSFNLLQRNYFPPERIALGLANLGAALEEGGLLVTGDAEAFTALRKRRGQLVPVLRRGEF